jgi:NAD(P)-dependent dehydrogenase (short-subunit alcohol dehydrogenase family)
MLAQSLARGAAKVYAGARRDHDWGDSRVVPLRLDVTDPAAIAAAAAAAQDTDVLINNAGVVGAHLGYADTPLIARLTDVTKSDPAVIVARILDALEGGEDEAIADDVSARVKSILSGITTGIVSGADSREL